MQNSLFDLENRYPSLSEAGSPLERLDAAIDWKIFRLLMKRIDAKEPKTAAGHRPICRMPMFKLLILQRLHNLSDERLQYQASVHDLNSCPNRQKLGIVLRATKVGGNRVWADSAYHSEDQAQRLAGSHYATQIHGRGYRNTSLTKAQETRTTTKSQVRACVESVFGYRKNRMGDLFLRSIGKARAKMGVGLVNLTGNLTRIEMLIREKVFDVDRIGASKMRGTA